MAHVVHVKAVKDGSIGCLNVKNYLLSLYIKTQNFGYAHKLFDEIPDRDVRSWTILISGLARAGWFGMVVGHFRTMQEEGVRANEFTLSSVLRSCSGAKELRTGKGIHGWIVRNEIDLDATLANALLDVYVKCGEFRYAERLFETGRERDTVAWNILIDGHIRIGDVEKSVALFHRLPFKDVASWNTVISGLMRNSHSENALKLLYEMVESGSSLSEFTFSTGLVLASTLVLLELGRQIHCRVLRLGIHDERFIRTSLVDFYCKCGKMDKALLIFREMPLDHSNSTHDGSTTEKVTWSSLITGYVQNDDYEGALRTFISMVREHIGIDRFTITTIASMCSKAGTLTLGQMIHALIEKIGHKLDSPLASSLVDMYSKCGNLEDARKIFKQAISPNVVLWSSMISACAWHGQGHGAISLFQDMIKKGIKPNEISFTVVLTACSHTGLVEEGCKYFQLMKEVYHIKPEIEHFACMVDLYGRVGHLDEAREFIDKHGISHLSLIRKSFLSSCRLHNNIEMARWATQNLESLDDGSHVLVANTLTMHHKWEEAAKVRRLMKERGVNKLPGQSWIQLKNQVHAFVAGDRSHPHGAEIYSYLDKLIGRLKEIGYSPAAEVVLQDIEEEDCELFLGYHSEKLAIAYGIISTPPGTPVRVMKNLRVCVDCHEFFKLTSQLLGREIVVRDIRRFHHFTNGSCSCGDYW